MPENVARVGAIVVLFVAIALLVAFLVHQGFLWWKRRDKDRD